MKRQLPAEKQYSANTQEDSAFKKKLVSMLEETEKEHAQSLQKLSDNIEKLTNSIADGFTLLRQSIYRQHSFAMDPMPPYPQNQNHMAFQYGNIPQAHSSMASVQGMRHFSHTHAIYQEEKENDDCI